MNSVHCIVVDDEPLACKLISSYVSRTQGLLLDASFTSSVAALDYINTHEVDLAFLDVDMPGLSGIELARRIPTDVKLIFTTAYPDYAVDGFRLNAVHYLLKPISYPEFAEAVRRVADQLRQRRQFINVKSEYRLIRIPVDDIVFIEALKDYIKIYTCSGEKPILTLMSLKNVEALLPSRSFMRVHRSFIANTDRIRLVEQSHIVYDSRRIPVSDSYKEMLLSRLAAQQSGA